MWKALIERKKSISILLLLLILSIGFYFGTKNRLVKNQPVIIESVSPVSVSPTQNWKTYNSPQERITMNYPSTWQFQEGVLWHGAWVVSFFESSTTDPATSLGSDAPTNNFLISPYGPCRGDIFRKVWEDNPAGFASTKSGCFGETLVELRANSLKSKQIEDEMLNSLRILPNTADWKLYVDQKYGFSFSYPPDFTVTATTTSGHYPDHIPEYYVTITSPNTAQQIEDTGGEATDIISIAPSVTQENLHENDSLTLPVIASEEYFSSQTCYGTCHYVGTFRATHKTGFEFTVTDLNVVPVVLFQNNDDTWFEVSSLALDENPYRTIISTLLFDENR